LTYDEQFDLIRGIEKAWIILVIETIFTKTTF